MVVGELKRRLRLKAVHNDIYDTDEVLEILKHFEGTDNYAGALAYVCELIGTTPDKLWTMFEYVE